MKNTMRIFKRIVASLAASWWRLLLTFGANVAALNILFWLESRFTALAGRPVFDTQNDLTAAGLREQLPLYVGEARSAYFAFAAFDFLFPLIGALAMATLIAWLLRHNPSPLVDRLWGWHVPLLPFAAALFDWFENMVLLAVVGLGADAPALLFNLAIVAKRLKLAALGGSAVLVVSVLLFTLVVRFRTWRRRAPA